MTPVVERAPTKAAPRVTAAQVSRPIGSATRLSFGIFGNCLRTSGNLGALVMTKIFFAGTIGRTRSTASCKKDFLPRMDSNCLGVFSRLNGQKRSPRPPAMMMTKRSLRSGLVFIVSKLPRILCGQILHCWFLICPRRCPRERHLERPRPIRYGRNQNFPAFFAHYE